MGSVSQTKPTSCTTTMFRFVAVLALAGYANARGLHCPQHTVEYKMHMMGGDHQMPMSEHAGAKSGVGFRSHSEDSQYGITQDVVRTEPNTYALIHQQGVDPMSGTPFEQCMPWDMVMSFDDLQEQICSYTKSCGRNIPCPDAFPGYGMCDCYESTWDMPEKVYALHNSGVPGLVVIEPEAPPSDFDDDWMPAPPTNPMMIVFEDFKVDHNLDDSLFVEPCVPDVPHLRASSKAKKSAQKKAKKLAKAIMAKNPLMRKRKRVYPKRKN